MTLPDVVTDAAELQSKAADVGSLRHAVERFRRRLTDTLPVVEELADRDSHFGPVARSIVAATVNLQLTVAVLGSDAVLPLAMFDGPVAETRTGDPATPLAAEGDDSERDAWRQVFALQRSAISVRGRVNRWRLFAVQFGLTRAQQRVVTAAVLALGQLIETIGGLHVPDDYYELVR